MNIAVPTSTRVFTQGNLAGRTSPFVLPFPEFRILFVFALIVLCALTLLYVKDLNRRLFIDYQELQREEQKLEIKRNELILKTSALTTPSRIQQIATENLGMGVPTTDQLVLIKVT